VINFRLVQDLICQTTIVFFVTQKGGFIRKSYNFSFKEENL